MSTQITLQAYGTRGIMKSMLGRIDSGLDDLNTAIEIDPQYPMLYIVRSQILELKGNCQAVIENYEKAMSFNPEKFNTKADIAWILAACPDSNFRDSKKALRLSLESLDSSSEDEHSNLRAVAAAYAGMGDFKNAIIYQNRAIQAIKTFVPEHKLSKIYHDNELSKYLEQLESYKNNSPWYFKKS